MIVSAFCEFFEVGDCMRVNFVRAFEGARVETSEIGSDCKPVVFPGFFVVVELQEVTDGGC